MRRTICLTTLTAVAVLTAVAANEARQERFGIRTLELADNLYVLTSDPAEQGMRTGGNTAVFVTASGVTLVDTKIRGYGEDILAEVARITDNPVTTIINTHTHWDHSGANTEFPDTVDFVVHENTAGHMASTDCDDGAGYQGGSIKNCEAFTGDDARFLPKITFATRTSLYSGADQIDLYYFGRGHTDGDTWIVFREARAMHTGDMMARKGLPFIDADNTNGSATEFGQTLKNAVDAIEDVDTIIPGHNDDPLTWDDLVDYAAFYDDLLTRAQAGAAAGQSVEETVAAYSVPEEYSDFQAPAGRVEQIVGLIYEGR